jgi:glycosyltransferase involved in cell wall biosynthesis
MNIVFNLGSLEKGGAERVASNLCNYLIENNEVSIITSIKSNNYYKLKEDIKLYNLDEGKPDKNLLKKNISRLKKMNYLIRKIKPDIIVSFLPEPSYRILFLKIFNKNLKIIVSVRNDPKIEYKATINRLIMKILYPLADGFVFQTQEAKEYFSKKIQKKSAIIPNPINEEFICEPYNGEREKIIVTVGRLEEQKNHKMLIEAFSKLPKQFSEYRLIIYGEGSLRCKLEEQIKELNLTKRVLLPGQVDNIKEKIYKASLFVLPSNYEGMPNALMEAMSLGLPCISTDCPCGGAKFLIENQVNGILIKTKNMNEMKNTIEYMLKNEKERIRIGQNAIAIKEELSPRKINKNWEDFIVSNIK